MKSKEEELSELQADNQRLYEDALIKDSMLLEYQQALGQAHFQQARLNGILKVREKQINELQPALDNDSKPTA